VYGVVDEQNVGQSKVMEVFALVKKFIYVRGEGLVNELDHEIPIGVGQVV